VCRWLCGEGVWWTGWPLIKRIYTDPDVCLFAFAFVIQSICTCYPQRWLQKLPMPPGSCNHNLLWFPARENVVMTAPPVVQTRELLQVLCSSSLFVISHLPVKRAVAGWGLPHSIEGWFIGDMHWVLAHIEVWVLMLFYVCWSLGSQCVCLFSQENEMREISLQWLR
jgi:hypothetical protein